MKTINISLGERSYPIYVGQNLFDQKELLCKHLPGKRVAIVTNKTVGKLYLEKICNLLDEKEPKLIFSNESSEINLENRTNVQRNYCKVVIKPTSEELEAHKIFLKKELKKNYY